MLDDHRLPALTADGELLMDCLRRHDGDPLSLIERLCRDYPERAEALRRLHELLDEFGLLDEPAPDEADLWPAKPAAPKSIGPYRVLDVLGSGGMGIVYLAEHEQLRRRVALKVIHTGLAQTQKARDRFEREAAIASRLDHSGICPVYELGEHEGAPFLAMRFVPGRTLAQEIAASRSAGRRHVALPSRDGDSELTAVLRYGEEAAQALHVAHEAGLVHRDVKPGNLMVTPDGEPVLLDFGLARTGDSENQSLTLTGDALGTPHYMAPEQVAGAAVDRRADVYALGVTLYECLTLRTPFRAVNRQDLASQVLHTEPPDPRRINRAISRDLSTVMQTAMTKEPARRYATALAFAEDLRRLRRREPILARRAGPLRRLSRFVERNPLAAGFIAFLLLAVGAFAVLLQQRGDALRTAQANEQSLQATAMARTSPAAALKMALDAVETRRTVETVSALYAALCEHHERLVLQHGKATWAADFSHDGERIVTCTDGGLACVWDRQGALVRKIRHDYRPGVAPGNTNAVLSFDLAPRRAGLLDGRFVTASFDGTARIFDRDGQQLHLLDHLTADNRSRDGHAYYDPDVYPLVVKARFSPDGHRVATSCVDHKVRVWDATTGKLIGEPLTGHRTWHIQLAWSARGLLATADDMKNWSPETELRVRLWRPEGAGYTLQHDFQVSGSIHDLGFAPDDSALVGACHSGAAYVWDLAATPVREPVRLPHGGVITSAAFSPTGLSIVTGSQDATARLWSRSGGLIREARHDGPVIRTAFAGGTEQAGELRVLTTSADATARVFDAELRPLLVLRGHTDWTVCARLSPDGRQVVTSGFDDTVRVWDLDDAAVPRLLGHTGCVRALARLGDGQIVSASDDLSARVWDQATGRSRCIPLEPRPLTLALSKAGTTMLVGHYDSKVRLYDLGTGEVTKTFPLARSQWALGLLLGDGRVLVAGAQPRWRVFAESREEPCQAQGETLALAHAAQRRLVAGAGRSFEIQVVDESGAPVVTVPAPRRSWIFSLAWSPDERRLAAGSHTAGEVWVWTIAHDPGRSPGAPLQLADHGGAVLSLAWSPSGKWLAAGVSDGTVHLWSIDPSAEPERVAVLRGHGGASIHALVFASDERLLSGGADGAIQTWTTSIDELIELAKQRLPREATAIRDEPFGFKYELGVGNLRAAREEGARLVELAIAQGDTRLLDFIARTIVGVGSDPAHEELLELAERAATQAVALAPASEGAYCSTLARIRFLQGDIDAALELQTQAVAAMDKQTAAERRREQQVLSDYRLKKAGK